MTNKVDYYSHLSGLAAIKRDFPASREMLINYRPTIAKRGQQLWTDIDVSRCCLERKKKGVLTYG